MLRTLDITTWSNQSLREYKEILEQEMTLQKENFKVIQNLSDEYNNVISILRERMLNGDI